MCNSYFEKKEKIEFYVQTSPCPYFYVEVLCPSRPMSLLPEPHKRALL